MREEDPQPGQLMRLAPGLDWHNAYIINSRDQIMSAIQFTKSDTAVYISSRINSYDGAKRYRCLVGESTVMFSPLCLVSYGEAE